MCAAAGRPELAASVLTQGCFLHRAALWPKPLLSTSTQMCQGGGAALGWEGSCSRGEGEGCGGEGGWGLGMVMVVMEGCTEDILSVLESGWMDGLKCVGWWSENG